MELYTSIGIETTSAILTLSIPLAQPPNNFSVLKQFIFSSLSKKLQNRVNFP
jgi:hypothetical protein